MIKALKWTYKLGYEKATNKVLDILERELSFHQSQEQFKGLQESGGLSDLYIQRAVSAEEYGIRAKEVSDILHKLDPEKYPDLDKFIKMMS